MATEMLWKKEDLYEVDWVKEQTKSALSGLQKEVLYTKNGDDVSFDIDTSISYLNTIKDKKTYKEVMEQNSWATIMAIQILLKNKWYNVGKIDWVLKSSWKSTSKTMEWIKEFQKKNGLYPDGTPGPKTINKLLEAYGNVAWNNVPDNSEQVKDLTKSEYWTLTMERSSITDEEMKQVVKYANKNDHGSVLFGRPDPLNKVRKPSITSITDKQAEELSKLEDGVELDWLTNITDKQVEELLKWKIKWVSLGWLTSITEKQAEELSKLNEVSLNWLTSITDKQAEELWKVKQTLSLNWLTSLTDKQAEELVKTVNRWLYLGWLTSLTDKQAEALWKVKARLNLKWLTSITDKQAENLATNVGYLEINENILTPHQKQILKKAFL